MRILIDYAIPGQMSVGCRDRYLKKDPTRSISQLRRSEFASDWRLGSEIPTLVESVWGYILCAGHPCFALWSLLGEISQSHDFLLKEVPPTACMCIISASNFMVDLQLRTWHNNNLRNISPKWFFRNDSFPSHNNLAKFRLVFIFRLRNLMGN